MRQGKGAMNGRKFLAKGKKKKRKKKKRNYAIAMFLNFTGTQMRDNNV